MSLRQKFTEEIPKTLIHEHENSEKKTHIIRWKFETSVAKNITHIEEVKRKMWFDSNKNKFSFSKNLAKIMRGRK